MYNYSRFYLTRGIFFKILLITKTIHFFQKFLKFKLPINFYKLLLLSQKFKYESLTRLVT